MIPLSRLTTRRYFVPLASSSLAYLFAFSNILSFELYHVGLFIPLAIALSSVSIVIYDNQFYRLNHRAFAAIQYDPIGDDRV